MTDEARDSGKGTRRKFALSAPPPRKGQRRGRPWNPPAGPHRATYIALGAGVQSTALYVLAARRDERVPPVDCAVFADTGDEPAAVYDQLERTKRWGKANGGPPIHTVAARAALSELMRHEFVPIPAFTMQAGRVGLLRRQCTSESKIKPINRFVREKLLGLKPGERGGPDRRALCLKGFSAEEVLRVKGSGERWLDVEHPLLNAGLYRADCLRIAEEAGIGTTVKSACIYCPFHSDGEWRRMRDENPEEFEQACLLDEEIRHTADRKGYRDVVETGAENRTTKDEAETSGERRAEGSRNGVTCGAIYLHRSCRPLREVTFDHEDQPGLDLFTNECAGVCGI